MIRSLADALRRDVVGGVLLVGAALIAMLWANSPWRAAYASFSAITVGPASLHLDLDLATWAADGLLAIFFFVAGLELKREFVAGDLRSPRRAALPIAAAVGGMLAPALIYTAINAGGPGAAGWAIPTATDIAFAVSILALVGSGLPAALRTFLLTLAVVDDLLAITIIAVVYTESLSVTFLALALVPLAAFAVLVRRGVRSAWLLLPLAVLTWALVHASGVHATVAGVLLGFAVPVRDGTTERFEHRWRPISAGLAVPVFAFFAAGVTLVGGGLGAAFADPITLGIVAGLVAGKVIGIVGATELTQRLTRARLADELGRLDVLGVALLGGIGFTVSLLIGELAFGPGSPADEHVKVGVLTASLLAALLATVVLRRRGRTDRREGTGWGDSPGGAPGTRSP